MTAQAYEFKERLLFRTVADESVVLDLDSGEYYGLDPVATLAWQVLASGASLAEARDAIVQAFDVNALTAEADLDAFVLDLSSSGMVHLPEAVR